jgi:sporulation protein YlmC with PRC-barrel domain
VIVRVIVRLEDRALVRRFVHATRHEPVVVNAEQGSMAFDVPYRRVEAVLDRLAKSGVGRFSAYFGPHKRT